MNSKIIKTALFLGVISNLQVAKSQSLNIGDIAFIGMNTRIKEGFTIITLTDIPPNEKIYFSDRGIVDSNNYVVNEEGTSLFTAPTTGVPCGTIVSFDETSSNLYEIEGITGGTITLESGIANLSLGDQIYAYQTADGLMASTPSEANFIAGIMSDYDESCTHETNYWTKTSCVDSTSESIIPPGLENGLSCIAVAQSEEKHDNMKYTGVLTGSKDELLKQINDDANWEVNDVEVLDIYASGYPIPTVNCSNSILTTMEFKLDNNVKIFPNPTSGKLNIKGVSENKKYSIYNLIGKKVKEGIINVDNSINVNEFLAGIYFFKINTNKPIRFIKK